MPFVIEPTPVADTARWALQSGLVHRGHLGIPSEELYDITEEILTALYKAGYTILKLDKEDQS